MIYARGNVSGGERVYKQSEFYVLTAEEMDDVWLNRTDVIWSFSRVETSGTVSVFTISNFQNP